MSGNPPICADLKGARERLCRAQVGVPPVHVEMLQRALDEIDRVAVFHCPDWSRFDDPLPADPAPAPPVVPPAGETDSQ